MKLSQVSLFFLMATSSYLWPSAIGAQLSSSALDKRQDPDPYRQHVCFRVACQVQACIPNGKSPDVSYSADTAACLFADDMGDDCGSIVSGIGYPQNHAYLACPAGQQLRQFQYDVWRATNARLPNSDMQLPTGDKRFPIRAYATNCTSESGVKCDGKVSGKNCNTAQCKQIGCRVGSKDYGGCDFKN